jgi:hypothetical protein
MDRSIRASGPPRAIAGLFALAAAVIGALAGAGCAARPACAIGPSRAAAGPPFLWRVARPEGPVLWLYGTLHHGRAQVAPAALAALAGAGRFVSELGDAEPDPERLRELSQLPPGKGLDARLAADDWWDLRDALRDAMSEAQLRRARPWLAMSQLTAALVPSPRPTMDVALARRARARGLPVDALETWEEQLTALDATVTIAELTEAIRARRTMRCQVEAVIAAYGAGDLAAMGQLLGAAQARTLLTARNHRWLPQLERYLAAGGAFAAVGVSHLAGEQGLPALLARAGYAVERVAEPARAGSPAPTGSPARTGSDMLAR